MSEETKPVYGSSKGQGGPFPTIKVGHTALTNAKVSDSDTKHITFRMLLCRMDRLPYGLSKGIMPYRSASCELKTELSRNQVIPSSSSVSKGVTSRLTGRPAIAAIRRVVMISSARPRPGTRGLRCRARRPPSRTTCASMDKVQMIARRLIAGHRNGALAF